MPAPEPGQKWGILGGTFDPVHSGHLMLGREIRQARRLDGVIFLPTFAPPHRADLPGASFDDRVVMLETACQANPAFIVSRVEETLDRPSYTIRTVRALRQANPGVDFSFIIGADNLGLLRAWHQWETLLEEIRLLVGCRPGADTEVVADYPGIGLDLVETSLVDISSSEIRRGVRRGMTEAELSRLVPPPVAAYIIDRGLYR